MIRTLARRRIALGFAAGGIALALAHPTWTTWATGFLIAAAGEGVRVWAAGHLEKGSEVTTSGPYRWTRHPLYVGSSVIAIGVLLAARSPVLAAVASVYLVATLTAAISAEEAHLREKFGGAYDRYERGHGASTVRAFSFERAMRNRDYRAVIGLIGG